MSDKSTKNLTPICVTNNLLNIQNALNSIDNPYDHPDINFAFRISCSLGCDNAIELLLPHVTNSIIEMGYEWLEGGWTKLQYKPPPGKKRIYLFGNNSQPAKNYLRCFDLLETDD